MFQASSLRSVFLALLIWADICWAVGLNELPDYLRSFRNYKRQGGTPGPYPDIIVPNTTVTPGLSKCMWAATNPWQNCGLANGNNVRFNQSACVAAPGPINALKAPYQDCVAIAWFEWNDFEDNSYTGNTPQLPLPKNATYVLSWSANVVVDTITIWNAGYGNSKKYSQVSTQNPKNKSGLYTFTKKDDGNTHFEFGFDYGHPNGNVTLFQQPENLGSLAQYAALISTLPRRLSTCVTS